MPVPPLTSAALAPPLLAWFDRAQRDMPWRKTRDPYAIWLSETMLQQTQVETVKPYYAKFLQRFPTVADLAAAPLEEVLKLWAGLGYYRRAKHLHLAAQAIATRHAGALPTTAAGLRELPGIGRYTAGAVASIAFGQQVAVLDGNVMRVLTRLLDLADDIAQPATQQKLWSIAETLVPAARPGDFNQAMMELGATVCTPQNPACLLCPVRDLCAAAAHGTQGERPVKAPKAAVKELDFSTLVLRHGEHVLLLQRPAGSVWEHLWEFPSFAGKVKTPAAAGALAHAELGLAATMEKRPTAVEHHLTHRTMRFRVFRGTAAEATVPSQLPLCGKSRYEAARWVLVKHLQEVPVAKITLKIAASAGLEVEAF